MGHDSRHHGALKGHQRSSEVKYYMGTHSKGIDEGMTNMMTFDLKSGPVTLKGSKVIQGQVGQSETLVVSTTAAQNMMTSMT